MVAMKAPEYDEGLRNPSSSGGRLDQQLVILRAVTANIDADRGSA